MTVTLESPPLALSGANAGPLFGHTQPRLFTPPLRELTRETSYGFAVIDFARHVLGEPLDPWEEWAVIHAGELLPDGRPRFRQLLILVARQNGKTHLLKVLALFWLFVEQWPLTVGMSTNLDYAREAWEKAAEIAEANEVLATLLPKGRGRGGIRRANGEQCITSVDNCRYKIAASNRKGGRSLSIDRLILDELREHHDWEAWSAAVPAMNARPEAQVFCISNQGDDKSVVLDSLRDAALEFIKTGKGDRRLGLFEWSAPDGADLLDRQAWAAANPNLGYRIDPDAILGPAERAAQRGGEEEASFRTEVLCQRVKALDAAVDPGGWADCMEVGSMAELRSRVALCLDVSPDRQHATLAAAAVQADGRCRVEVVASWDGVGATQELRRDLGQWVRKVGPQALGWIPNGPAAALAADLKERKGRVSPFPANCTTEEIRAEVSAVCMGLADLVDARQVVHSDDPLLNGHILSASKLWNGDVWRFSRKGEGQCDAAYAAAGAIHLARTLPTPVGRPRILRSA